MNGAIDKDGNLHIERGGELLAQSCKFVSIDEYAIDYYCTHFCPLFGEPWVNNGKTMLELCQGRILKFDSFVDERNS
jgi:hypothetical protein